MWKADKPGLGYLRMCDKGAFPPLPSHTVARHVDHIITRPGGSIVRRPRPAPTPIAVKV